MFFYVYSGFLLDILLKVALNMIKANQTTNQMGNNLVGDTVIGSLKAQVTNIFITPHLLFLGQKKIPLYDRTIPVYHFTYIMYCKIVLDVMNIDESTEAYYEHSLNKIPNTRLPYESNMLSKNKTSSEMKFQSILVLEY